MGLCLFHFDLGPVFFRPAFCVSSVEGWPEVEDLFVLFLVDPLAHPNLLEFRISHSITGSLPGW